MKIGGRSFICSLAQPSPELFRLFDTIMVLSKGAVIYFGARREVVQYFAQLGFPCPDGKPIPEYLEELSAIPHMYYKGNHHLPIIRAYHMCWCINRLYCVNE